MIRLEAPSVTEIQNALGASFLAARNVAIFAGGEPSLPADRPRIFDLVVAADSGLALCEKAGFKPHLIIGDMDSCDPAVLVRFPDVPIAVYPCDKDKSDLELACQIFAAHSCALVIYGALGGRTDHLLGNLSLVAKFPRPCGLFSCQQSILCLDSGVSSTITIGRSAAVLSLFSLSKAFNVRTQGLKWELQGHDIDFTWFSLSNQSLSGTFTITYDSGTLFLIVQNE